MTHSQLNESTAQRQLFRNYGGGGEKRTPANITTSGMEAMKTRRAIEDFREKLRLKRNTEDYWGF